VPRCLVGQRPGESRPLHGDASEVLPPSAAGLAHAASAPRDRFPRAHRSDDAVQRSAADRG